VTCITRLGKRVAGLALPAALCLAACALVILAAGSHPDIVQKVLNRCTGQACAGDLGDTQRVINDIKGPATAIMGSLSGLGAIAGGAMMATGQQRAVGVLTMSVGSGAAVLLGNGLIA
jgi:hypothetical protein